MLNTHVWGKTFAGEAHQEYYPLICHMLDTVVTAEILFTHWLSGSLRNYFKQHLGNDALNYTKLAAGLHDIGKCSPVFQDAMLNPRGSTHSSQRELLEADGMSFPDNDHDISTLRHQKLNRHEKIAHWILSMYEGDDSSQVSANWLKTAIVGHHGTFEIHYKNTRIGVKDNRWLNQMHDEAWKQQIAEHIAMIESVCGVTVDKAAHINAPSELVILLSGLIVLADRLASQDSSVLESAARQKEGTLVATDGVGYCAGRQAFLYELAAREIGFPQPLTSSDVLGEYTPRGVQAEVPDTDGMWLVMAPTGAGKTEAALLRHTLKERENVAFFLPTKSTTDAIFGRLRKMYSNKDAMIATLAHGDAFLNDFYEQTRMQGVSCDAGLIPSGLTNAGARLSAPVSVATIDQMVMAGLPLKWSHVRLLTLANAHVIVDEAHLLDPYQITLLKDVFGFLGRVGSRVTILSATVPAALKKELAESYSGEFFESLGASFPSHDVFAHGSSASSEMTFSVDNYEADVIITRTSDPVGTHVDWVLEAFNESPQARLGVFVNTVDRCQNIASVLRSVLPSDVEVVCLHSRMLGRHRKNIVDNLLAKYGSSLNSTGKRVVLVGTQVIEMSLDIDLDRVSTDICPAPSFVQRVGRAWRNRSSEAFAARYDRLECSPPNIPVHVVVREVEKGSKFNPFLPYSLSLIKRALAFLEERPVLRFPTDIQEFVETSVVNIDEYYSSELEDAAIDDEISEEFFKRMQGDAIRSKISDVTPDCSMGELGGISGLSFTDDDVMTRLIDTSYPPVTILSDDLELINLGALPTTAVASDISDKALKAASVGLNAKFWRAFSDAGESPLKIGKFSYGFFCQMPEDVVYDSLLGLVKL